MNDGFRMRLYALTCIACIAWLVQSIAQDIKDGSLVSAPSIILIVCISVAILYTGVSAVQLWLKEGKRSDEGNDDAEDSGVDASNAVAANHQTKEQ